MSDAVQQTRETPRICNYEYTIMSGKFRMRGGKIGIHFLKKLPTPAEIRNQYPIDAAIQEIEKQRDQEIRDVFTGKSDKFLAIIGPCSADNEDAVCDYLLRLRKVQDKIAEQSSDHSTSLYK